MSKRPSYRRPSKAARRRALAELLDNLPEPPELPEEAEAGTPVEDRSNTGAGISSEPVTIHQDGKLLTGSTWVTPQDFATEEVQRKELPSLKGCTPSEWPTLDAEDTE